MKLFYRLNFHRFSITLFLLQNIQIQILIQNQIKANQISQNQISQNQIQNCKLFFKSLFPAKRYS